MRKPILSILALTIVACTLTAQRLEFLSPLPGSSSAPPTMIIVLRSSHVISGMPETLHKNIRVTGEGRRPIYVNVRRASDERTLNIIPITRLKELETITVTVQAGRGLPDTTFQFTTVRVPHNTEIVKGDGGVQVDPLPSDFPPITVTTNSGATPLDLYIAPNSRITPEKYGRFSMALDTTGAPRSFKRLSYWPFDFKVLPNGRMSISRFQPSAGASTASKIYVMDTSWAVVDSIESGNGYLTSFHDHMVLPNGHIVVQAFEDVIMDLSTIVEGGNPAAIVVQGIIQELDQDRNVVFQWRTLDHIPVTDSYEDLKAATIRYVHNNGVWVDHDGDLLVSLRHCSSVIRIDRASGNIKWLMGGKRNQFTFTSAVAGVADPVFSYQHDIRRTKNGISLFDNGTFRIPQYSRAVDYRIDENAKTAELVWTYRHTPEIYTSLQGGVQTLSNGHRVIAWGSAAANGHPGVTEVDSNGVVVFEATLPKELFVYRAQRHAWPPGQPSDTVFKDEVLPGNTYTYSTATDTVGIVVTFTSFTSAFYNATKGKRFPYSPINPRFEGVAPNVYPLRIWLTQEGITDSRLEVRFNLNVLGLSKTSGYEVYHRPTIGNGTFTKLLTQFTPDKRTLVVAGTDFGELLIADAITTPTQILSPIAVSPINGVKVLAGIPHTLQVSPRGAFDSLQVQGSRDSTFAGDQIVFDGTTRSDKVVTTPIFEVQGQRYYWRTRAFYGALVSEWTVAMFDLSAPYLTLDLPLNKFITYLDKNAPILWKTTSVGLGRIDLITKDNVILIKDSVKLQNQGYLWKVPLNTPVGTGYAIRITAYDDAPLADQSDTIVEVQILNGVGDFKEKAQRIVVSPQPSSSSLTLQGEFITNASQIMLFNTDGALVLSAAGSGTHEQTLNVEALPQGAYRCVLLGSNNVIAIPVMIVR